MAECTTMVEGPEKCPRETEKQKWVVWARNKQEIISYNQMHSNATCSYCRIRISFQIYFSISSLPCIHTYSCTQTWICTHTHTQIKIRSGRQCYTSAVHQDQTEVCICTQTPPCHPGSAKPTDLRMRVSFFMCGFEAKKVCFQCLKVWVCLGWSWD